MRMPSLRLYSWYTPDAPCRIGYDDVCTLRIRRATCDEGDET